MPQDFLFDVEPKLPKLSYMFDFTAHNAGNTDWRKIGEKVQDFFSDVQV